jgi:uncharacterized protein (DUF1778 family)
MERLETRIASDQKAAIVRAAALTGRSLTDFVVSSSYQAALHEIERHEVIHLNREDSIRFAEALLADSEPNENLRKAFKSHQEMLKC